MKLSVAIDEYTNRKRASGLIFRTEKVVLAGLNRQVNDLQLESLSTQHILNYLNSPTSSTRTWRGNYGILRHFFEFWSEQGAMPPLLMPQIRPPVRNSFVPYIYTRIQIRDLLKGVRKIGKTKLPKLDDETFRTILLVLYGTGAMTGEVFRLRCQDVDLKNRVIALAGNRIIQPRTIPIGPDLCGILGSYLQSKCRIGFPDAYLFSCRGGEPIKPRDADERFMRLRQRVGIRRKGGPRVQPSMRDFRSTFAVHRIASWIRSQADLNRMIPALSAYLGQLELLSTARFLSFTPERFRSELNKLSPKREISRWRDDPTLMTFLESL